VQFISEQSGLVALDRISSTIGLLLEPTDERELTRSKYPESVSENVELEKFQRGSLDKARLMFEIYTLIKSGVLISN